MRQFLVWVFLFAVIAPIPSQTQAQDMDWSRLAAVTWDGYKQRFIFCGANCGDDSGLVYDPSNGYQAVSEGVGYGLLMAVMMHDQYTFDAIYDAAHAQMLDTNTGLHHWRVDNAGNITGYSSATDAEQDIAAALIFAERRVQSGEWVQHPERPYGERANALIDAIWQYEVAEGRYLKAGDTFGDGQALTNLSYFSPAWYRIYDEFQSTDRWQPVIDQGYETLFATAGAARGLAPDWSTAAGQPAFDFCESIGRPIEQCAYEMRYDAIRVPWRIAVDCLWYAEPRACDWSARSASFLSGRETGHVARMYDMDGRTVVTYVDESMLGMWLTAAQAANNVDVQRRIEALIQQRSPNVLETGHFGDTGQYYFNQSLIWFGVALQSGDFAPVP